MSCRLRCLHNLKSFLPDLLFHCHPFNTGVPRPCPPFTLHPLPQSMPSPLFSLPCYSGHLLPLSWAPDLCDQLQGTDHFLNVSPTPQRSHFLNSSFPAPTLHLTHPRRNWCLEFFEHAGCLSPPGLCTSCFLCLEYPSPPCQPYWTLICSSAPSLHAASSALSLCHFPVPNPRESFDHSSSAAS